MEKAEFRAVMYHFYLKKWIAAQIKTELDEVHWDTVPMLKTAYFWINEFKRGRTSTKDEARLGRPVKATAAEMIEKMLRIVMENRRIQLREITKIVGISVSAVYNILHEKLEIKKICARWVPRLLTIDQKRTRKDFRAVFVMFKRNVQDFWR